MGVAVSLSPLKTKMDILYFLNFVFLLSYNISDVRSEEIKAFFLHSSYDYRNPLCTSCPDIECVHTEKAEILSRPTDITICYRSMPMTYQSMTNFWSTVFSFGSINDDFTDLEEGYLFGVWETGPWLGYKGSEDSVYEWLALGENFLHDLQIWRHSCLSIDFETGDVKLEKFNLKSTPRT